MTNLKTIVRGVGHYLPERIVTNDELAQRVDTSDEWITQRTGIKQRHVAGDDEFTSDLATKAGLKAIEAAGLKPQDIDLIVLATTTPDRTFPAAATTVQRNLGITHGAAFDIQAVCSGFVFAVATADSHLKNGLGKRALVIGAETFSRLLDWEDRTTCVLFGDGAGAMVLEAVPEAQEDGRGVLSSSLRSDGNHWEKLYVDGGPSSTGTVGFVRMQGREVFRHAVGMKLKIPAEKVVVTVDKHANTSAASVPMALSVAVDDGRIKQGDLVMIEAMGGGFTWAASLIRW